MIFGRPARGRDRQRQKRRKPARCQPITVSGFTRTRTSVQRGQHWRRAVQKSRSKDFNFGRGRFRFRTASCGRRARTSRAVSPRLRKKTRMATKKERTISITTHLLARRDVASPGRTVKSQAADFRPLWAFVYSASIEGEFRSPEYRRELSVGSQKITVTQSGKFVSTQDEVHRLCHLLA